VDVPVAHLIALHKARVIRSWRHRLRDGILARPHRIGAFARVSTVPGFVRTMGAISHKTPLPHRRQEAIGGLGPPLSEHQGRVGLFRDCYSTGYDPGLIEMAEALLTLWGFKVVPMPKAASCCGAAAYAAGKPSLAQTIGKSCWEALTGVTQVSAWITLNATCDGTLRDEWPRYFSLSLDVPVISFDEVAQRAPEEFWKRMRLVSQAKAPIITHTTCRGKVARGDGHLMKLAQRAGFSVVEPSMAACCGAAGSYAFKVEHEQTAQALAQSLAEQSQQVRPQGFMTDSGTCAIHIEHVTQVLTRHPAYWLYRQYRRFLQEVTSR
jgi:glycerol-3-phosphate dehydrogenase subunit C